MKGEKTKAEAELAMILDRFLLRSQLSDLMKNRTRSGSKAGM